MREWTGSMNDWNICIISALNSGVMPGEGAGVKFGLGEVMVVKANAEKETNAKGRTRLEPPDDGFPQQR